MKTEYVGKNLRRLMKRGGKTISEVANEIGISNVALSNILTGKSVPKSSTVIKLASTLQVPVHTLFMKPVVLSSIRFRTAKMLSPREKAAKQQVLLNCLESKFLYYYRMLLVLVRVRQHNAFEAMPAWMEMSPFQIYQSWFHSWASSFGFMILG